MRERKLFIGIAVGPELRAELTAAIKKLRIGADRRGLQAKWTPEANLHVTLAFLGQVSEERAQAAAAALADAAATLKPFSLEARGAGGFPSDRCARVLWAGVARTQALLDAQTAVEEALARHGFEAAAEERQWTPHVTLGRLRSPGAIGDLISPIERKRFASSATNELILFESVLRGNFVAHLPEARAQLGAEA